MSKRTLLAVWNGETPKLFPATLFPPCLQVELVDDQVHVTMRDPPREDGRCGYTNGQMLSAKEFATFLADLARAWEQLP